MTFKKWIVAGLAAVMVMAQTVPVMAAPDSSSSIEANITSLESQKAQLLGEIDSLTLQLVTSMAEIEDLKVQIDDKDVEIQQTEKDIEKAEKVRQKQYDAMKKRIQYLYENGGDASWLETLLNSDDLSNLLNQAEYTEKLYKYDRECLEAYAEAVQTVTDLKSLKEAEKASLENLKAMQESNKDNLTVLLDQAKASYADYDARIAQAVAMASQYQAIVAEQAALYNELSETSGGSYDFSESMEAMGNSSAGYSGGGSSSGSSSSGGGQSYSKPSGGSIGSLLAQYGMQYIGNPYVYGGNSLTNGIDCSGFVNQIYAAYGYSVPRNSGDLANGGSSVGSINDAQEGDVICYDGHVGIYIGNGQIVHASNEKDGIKVSDVNSSGDIVAIQRYY